MYNELISGTAAGVPFVAFPPATHRPEAPVVFAWHLMDPPRTPTAFAAALPLKNLDGWRVYLALPMSAPRLGVDEEDAVARAGMDDAVRKLKIPVIRGAVTEFPSVLDELSVRLELGGGPIGLMGGSDGAAVVGSILTDVALAQAIPVAAAVMVSPVLQLKNAVDATARTFGFSYPWDEETLNIARRHDLVARVDDLVSAGQPAIRVIVGSEDDPSGFVQPARDLVAALSSSYDDGLRVDLQVIDGMAHALAEEPGLEAAPQTDLARRVDDLATGWFRRFIA